MSDDLEYLDGFGEVESLGPCWACQVTVNTENCIRIAEQHVPVCKGCWQKIPEGQRILIAQKLSAAPQLESLTAAVQHLIARALETEGDGYWDRILGGHN